MIQRKVCLLGAYAAGKTSLIRRFVDSMFDDRYLTTVGVRVDKKVLSTPHGEMTLMIWDLAGEDDSTPVDLRRCRGSSGLVLVADGCRAHILDTAVRLGSDASKVAGEVPRILMINKADLKDEWEVTAGRIDGLRRTGWTLYLTSAKSGENVEEAFASLAASMGPANV